jgi:hypothetical protein
MKNIIRDLLREHLINEISSDDAWNTIYSDVNKFPLLKGDKVLFDKLEALYPKRGDQHNKGYFLWVYKLLKNGLKEEDFYKVKEYLELFNKYINVIPKDMRDIGRYKTIYDLLDVVKKFRQDGESGEEEIATSKKAEKKARLAKEVDVVYTSDRWTVKIPRTEWASCELGKGTEWCTAATKSDNRFESYNSDGLLYVLFNKEDNSRYQLHFETNQFMDVNDKEVPTAYFFDHVSEDEGLYDFFKEQSDRFYEFILKTSVDDMVDGGYSETFDEALGSVDKNSSELKEVLRQLRGGQDSHSVYLGYVYEDNPNNIDGSDVADLFNDVYMDEYDLNNILEHLKNIGFDFEDAGINDYLKYLSDLDSAKLEIGGYYKIDKGREVKINGLNFDDDEKPYNITITDGSNSKSGDIDFEGLKSLVYNMSLFERIKRKKY